MTIAAHATGQKEQHVGSPLEVPLLFLRLGVACFGGPIAHIGYFREEFVVRRRWRDEHGYADLVGLCQFLPGPGSSQVGFSLGPMRTGCRGGLSAWTGFTLPSAIVRVKSPGDFGIALVGFVLLTAWRTPPVVVAVSVMGGIVLALAAP